MKQLLDALHSAKRIEILIIGVMLCTLLVLYMGEGKPDASSEDPESRLEALLGEIEGAGEVQVMLAEDKGGALVLAEGADNMRTVLEIQRALRAITGLELDRIEIVKSG